MRRRIYRDLTDREVEEIKLLYPVTGNSILCETFNISSRSLYRFRQTYQLEKSEEYLTNIRKAATHKPRKPMSEDKRLLRIQKIKESQKKLWHSERLRLRWGLPQKTKLQVVAQSRREINARNRLKRRGYIIPERRSKTIYYDANSNRSRRVEESCTERFHFTFRHAMSEETHSKTPVKAVHSSYII